MKTRPFLLLVLFAALFITERASAQTDNTASMNLSINLSADVISIDLGGAPDVSFVYDDAADYAGSKTEPKTGHLTVVSNQAYDISVAASQNFSSTGTESLDLGVVQVAVDPATANGAQQLNSVPLANAPVSGNVIVENAPASIGAVYNVNYTIPTAAPLLSLGKQVFSTTVVYTATQR